MDDRRRYCRDHFAIEVDLNCPVMGKKTYFARDVSLGGLFLVSNEHVETPVGTILSITLKHPEDDRQNHTLKGKVMHVNSDGLGLMFHKMEIEYFSFLEEVMFAKKAKVDAG